MSCFRCFHMVSCFGCFHMVSCFGWVALGAFIWWVVLVELLWVLSYCFGCFHIALGDFCALGCFHMVSCFRLSCFGLIWVLSYCEILWVAFIWCVALGAFIKATYPKQLNPKYLTIWRHPKQLYLKQLTIWKQPKKPIETHLVKAPKATPWQQNTQGNSILKRHTQQPKASHHMKAPKATHHMKATYPKHPTIWKHPKQLKATQPTAPKATHHMKATQITKITQSNMKAPKASHNMKAPKATQPKQLTIWKHPIWCVALGAFIKATYPISTCEMLWVAALDWVLFDM